VDEGKGRSSPSKDEDEHTAKHNKEQMEIDNLMSQFKDLTSKKKNLHDLSFDLDFKWATENQPIILWHKTMIMLMHNRSVFAVCAMQHIQFKTIQKN